MSLDLAYTLAVLAISILLFASDRFRLDVVALFSLLALVLGGILPFEEAVEGFSSPLVLMIIGLFVVGAGLTETGVADWLGNRLGRIAGESEVRLLVVVMLATAAFSAFMSSTGTVAILLPVVGSLAQRRGIPLARVFLPLAFSAHLGSLLTLIATPPNLVVSEALAQSGREPFQFFSFAPVGSIILAVGVLYMVFFGRQQLPAGAAPRPPGKRLSHQDLAADYGLASRRLGMRSRPPLPWPPFASRGSAQAALTLAPAQSEERTKLTLYPDETMVEVVLTRRSGLEGKTLREARFRDRYRASVLGIRRGAKGLPIQEVEEVPLAVGDMLLLKGRRKHLRNLRDERRDFVLVASPDPPAAEGIRRGPAFQALFITLAMLVVMAFGWIPHAVAVLSAALALTLFNIVRPTDAYQAVNWESVVVIAGMLPMATALDRTGATAALVSFVESNYAQGSPYGILAALMLVTSTLGLFISNTATAVLVAPLAVRVAEALQISPEPLLVGVAVAASAAFSTPVASPVNSLVVGPGGYRFRDFLRVGLPLHLLVLLVALALVPLFFPF